MSVLTDRQIRERRLLPVGDPRRLVIEPFVDYDDPKPAGVIGYGLSSTGVDLRAGQTFLIFANTSGCVVDPKLFDPGSFRREVVKPHEAVLIPPNCFALAETMEYLEIPKDCVAQITGKSTYARVGYVIPATPAEAMWKGVLTLEIGNLTPLPLKVYACEGICQILYHQLSEYPERDYDTKKVKHYQNQQGLSGPRV